jgi:hypothetical protein
MGLAEEIITLVVTLAPIAVKLASGGISEDEARKQSREAIAAFASRLADGRDEDAKRDAETDAKLDEIDKAHSQR